MMIIRGCLTLLFLLVAVSAQALSLRSIWLNHQGQRLLDEQKPAAALEKFAEALALDPDSPELHNNLGIAFALSGETEKALQSFRTAERLANGRQVQLEARYNQGSLLQKEKKVDEALEAYHRALEIDPTSRETKINIELLIQDQQGKGQGQGDNKDQDKDQKQGDKGQDQKDKQDNKDGQGQDQKKEDQPKQYQQNKPQPKPFKSEELTQGDVNKILGELRNQEQRIRSEYNKREVKEKPRDKDW